MIELHDLERLQKQDDIKVRVLTTTFVNAGAVPQFVKVGDIGIVTSVTPGVTESGRLCIHVRMVGNKTNWVFPRMALEIVEEAPIDAIPINYTTPHRDL